MHWPEAPHLELLGIVRSLLGVVGTCRDLGVVGSCQDLSGLCRDFVRTCWDLLGVCWDLSGGIGNVDFMESHFEGIAIVVNKILAEFPIPEILRSVPEI